MRKEEHIMAADSAIYVRIDSDTKSNAESIIRELGLTPSAVIAMLYRQIILTHGVPFNVRLPIREPIATGNMTPEEIRALLDKAEESIKRGDVFTVDETKEILEKGYGIPLSNKSLK